MKIEDMQSEVWWHAKVQDRESWQKIHNVRKTEIDPNPDTDRDKRMWMTYELEFIWESTSFWNPKK